MVNKTLTNNRKLAIISGLSLLLMAILAGYGYGYVFQNIYIANSGSDTLYNLRHSEFMFRLFQYAFILVFVLDVVVSCTLYLFFRQVSKKLSLFTALFRLIYSVVLLIALLKTSEVLSLLHDVNCSECLIMNGLGDFLNVWSLGLILFGGHLLLLGVLILKSVYVPDYLGVLVVIASVCYIITNVANLLIPDYTNYKETVDMILSAPMAIGELALAVWLVFKGAKVKYGS